ncbi:MAG: UDP-3-O-acyl-N-acetylglucosamine deacetylase [Desulfuromonadaceae bacterium]|nr:UDP-3-O-acyl-N-acetylglucosamine deacetylase [Desulfuromonadaceae bacterium]
MGDFYTCGYRILGKVDAYKTGHHLNNLFLKELFSDPQNYSIY